VLKLLVMNNDSIITLQHHYHNDRCRRSVTGASTSRQAGMTSGSGLWNNGDIAPHGNQNGGADVNFRYALSNALRLHHVTLPDEAGSLSTRSSPVHHQRPTTTTNRTTSDLARHQHHRHHHQQPALPADDLRPRTVLPEPSTGEGRRLS